MTRDMIPAPLPATMMLADGVRMPRLAFGLYDVEPGATTQAVTLAAIAAGYRHIDTAQLYRNEADVGEAIRRCELPRDQLFVTTKVAPGNHGFDEAREAVDRSLGRLGLDHVDLLLIHFPVPRLRSETWRALVDLRAAGKARSIGVSNYTVRHLEELLGASDVAPSVNQVELSPFCQQPGLAAFCRERGIVLEAYSPLTRGAKLSHPAVVAIAERRGRSAAQILLRWAVQRGHAVAVKTTTPARMRENAALFDFDLTPDDLTQLAGLDEDFRTCWNPTDVP